MSAATRRPRIFVFKRQFRPPPPLAVVLTLPLVVATRCANCASGRRPDQADAAWRSPSSYVVGDIGDGAVHQVRYRCANGKEPIGKGPRGLEGAVCCPL